MTPGISGYKYLANPFDAISLRLLPHFRRLFLEISPNRSVFKPTAVRMSICGEREKECHRFFEVPTSVTIPSIN
jgi:hypothetical protein